MKNNRLIVPNMEKRNNFIFICKKINIFSAYLEGLEENLQALRDDGKFEIAEIEFLIIFRIRREIQHLCETKNSYEKTYDFSQLGFFENEMDIASENEAENLLMQSMNSYISQW